MKQTNRLYLRRLAGVPHDPQVVGRETHLEGPKQRLLLFLERPHLPDLAAGGRMAADIDGVDEIPHLPPVVSGYSKIPISGHGRAARMATKNPQVP